MTSAVFALYITCVFLETTANQEYSSVHQQHRFISVKSGENLTLHCFSAGSTDSWFYWFKQTLGQKPRLISTFYKYDTDVGLSDEFKSDPRFTLDADSNRNHLIIKDLHISDSATYFCVKRDSYVVKFTETITVSVEGSAVTVPALVHHSTSGSIQSGDSVTLDCTVHTGTCDGEHSVYWFKQSQESHPGLIYTHGGRNDQCERKDNTQTHTCVYNLPLKDLDVSHAGTYYCAVASCGHILFGNGTKLDFNGDCDSCALVTVLSSTSIVSTILSILLAFFVCILNRTNSCLCADSHSAPTTTNAEDDHEVKRQRRQRDDTWTECVYFTVEK